MRRPFFTRRRSKFNVDHSAAGKAVRTVDGIVFHSQREAAYYRVLKALEAAGQIDQLQRQVAFPIVVKGVRVAVYKADFSHQDRATGQLVVTDVKGYRTESYRLKKALVEALYGIRIRET